MPLVEALPLVRRPSAVSAAKGKRSLQGHQSLLCISRIAFALRGSAAQSRADVPSLWGNA